MKKMSKNFLKNVQKSGMLNLIKITQKTQPSTNKKNNKINKSQIYKNKLNKNKNLNLKIKQILKNKKIMNITFIYKNNNFKNRKNKNKYKIHKTHKNNITTFHRKVKQT